ncbi:carbohydrate ABC transporter permease [Rhodoferax aquaticus]|uniref:Maltose/maltodextrin transport system permease protein MalG n=1 Tax=Rhodoferax aquaticus TaxID=2527691 RepID=A0A515ER92_9BURK|nr:carbohydrate ABC transporter permease [Rhodoferax aquaticus]QDL55179.1 carbohydrate ABC transporter permease [Rhodoferax aquaticus]
MKYQRLGARVALYAAVALFVVVTLAPLYWLLVMSVSTPVALTRIPLQWWPDSWDFSRYTKLISDAGGPVAERFLAALRNSLVVSVASTVIAMVAAIPAAYSFSRYPGRQGVLYGAVAVYMLPSVAFVLPLYLILSGLGMLNNVLSLVLVYCTILLPFTTWMLKNNFDQVPHDIEQAAHIDGAGVLGVIWRITLPLALPALGATALFAFLLAWDEFFYALIYTNDIRAKTLPVTIADFAAGRATDYGLISAVGVLAALPPMLIGLLLQRTLVSGLTAGGTKG